MVKDFNLRTRFLPLRLFLFFFLAFFLFFAKNCLAANEFSTTYDISYHVDEKGNTLVQQNIQLTNRMTNIFVSEYTFTIPTSEIYNIEGEDGLGPLKINSERQDKSSTIQVVFNERVVGRGKTLKFTLRFEMPEIAEKNGNIWEIHIPSLEEDESISSYQVSLAVPEFFGKIAYVYPKPKEEGKLIWGKEAMKKGIVVLFGEKQIFSFNLSYHLKNRSISPARYKIALPPDTFYQKMYFSEISPPPEDVVVDGDGNWLAIYTLIPGQKLDIRASGKALVSNQPRFKIKKDVDFDKLTKERKFWEVENVEIKALAEKLKTAENIYQYVVSKLNYNYERVSTNAQRMGALKALSNPNSAICMEFTDLFIALARAAGIPAREVEGFAYTTDPLLRPVTLGSDILHSWPEYWDKEKEVWIAVDPTWGKTTGEIDYFNGFDFNHLAFVIHGLSSEKPYPAGSYKSTLQVKKKDVEVNFATQEPEIDFKPIKITMNFPKKVLAGESIYGEVVIQNLNGAAVYDLPLRITASSYKPSVSRSNIWQIPPFGKKSFPIELIKTKSKVSKKEKVAVFVGEGNGSSQSVEIEILPFSFLPLFQGYEKMTKKNLFYIGGITAFSIILLWVWRKKKSY